MAVSKKINWKTIILSMLGGILLVAIATGIGLKGILAATKANMGSAKKG